MKHRPGKLLKRHFVTILEERLKESLPLIQVILGPRQVGKTTGVQMLSGFDKEIYYANADDSLSQTQEWITEQWQAAKLASATPTLIIDEVQKVLHWSEKVKSLWDSEKRKGNPFKLILLGSSSLSLSQGLDESLAGRFEVIPVYHWSYDESQRQFGYSLDDYLIYGGYPESAKFKGNYRRWSSYLRSSIIETVIGKDILRQATVRKPALFRQTFEILSAYPAQEVSYNKLLGQLQEGGNTDLVKHYIQLFESAFLFKSIHKFSGSTVRQKASSPKIFPLCPSLHAYKIGDPGLLDSETRGRVFEAAVGAELSKLPGDLFYWRDKGTAEVDFIFVQGRKIFAIEVKSGRRKSTSGMTEFLKQYPKANPIFISPEQFGIFSKNPEEFFERVVK